MVANANPPSASFQFDRVWTVALVEGDPKIAFVGRESGAIEKYDAAKLDAAKPLLALHGHTASVTGIIAPSADEIHTVSVDGTMRTWNTAAEVEGKREGKVVQLGGAARCILAVGEAYYVGLSTGVVVKVEGGKVVAQLKGHADTIAALAASETSLFTASYDYTIRSWDLTTGAVQHIYSGHSNHVKAIFAVNGTQLIGLGRDDNLIVWNIPSQDASAAADAPPDAEVVGEADPPTPRGQAKSHGLHAEATPQVKPAGVLALPSSPHTAALVGNQLAIACVDGSIRGIGVKALLKSVADYHAELEASIKAATRKIEQNCSIKIKNAKRLGKRAIRELHAQLVAEATGEPAHPPAATAEGDEAAQEEGGGDDAPAVAIGPEREAKLAEFTSKTSAHVEKEVHAAQKEKKDHIAALAPLTQQRFTQTKEKFPASPFCYTFRGTRPDAVVCAAADGTTGVLTGCGTKVEIVPCRIGVQSL